MPHFTSPIWDAWPRIFGFMVQDHRLCSYLVRLLVAERSLGLGDQRERTPMSRFFNRRTMLLAMLAAVAWTLGDSSAQANLLTNGDFETGNVLGQVDQGLNGWTATGSVFLVNGFGYQACCGATGTLAELTNKSASFGAGDKVDNGVLSQQFATSAGQTYTLAFDYGAVANPVT